MPIVGTLLKETTRVGYSYSKKKKRTVNINQENELIQLLQKARKTEFGQKYNFSNILSSGNIKDAFRDSVSLFTYETLYSPWIEKVLEGKKNVIWPGKINYFALSSGTTAGSSKRIPVTDKMIRQFQKTSINQLVALHELDFSTAFFESSVLTIGGSTELTEVNGHYEGDLSGILQKHKSFIFKPFSKPGNRIAQIKNWDEKINKIVEKAPLWDIGVIAGVPAWIIMLLERIIDKYALNTIHDIWPNFKLYLHGGVFLDNYKSKLDKLCGQPIYYQNTYLASEGYFAYQKLPNQKGMTLLQKHGIYYEFLEEKYFDQVMRNTGIENLPTLLLEEVKENVPYGLVISTISGLWRYVIGDVVKFTDINNYELEITGRVSHYLNMTGEHLSLDNLTSAIQNVSSKLNIAISEFCVIPSKKCDRHYWYIGSNQFVDAQFFGVELNAELERLNDDYKALRTYIIKPPKVKFLPLQKFYDYMELKGKAGGQHKFPRVLNPKQTADWEAFLNCLEW
jgi:hypothetical protein